MGDSRSLEVGGRVVVVSNPDKVIFPEPGVTKLDLVNYYLAVADGALRGVARRPMILKRFVKGIAQEAIFQKRAPEKRPDWIDVAELKYASGTSAKEAVIDEAAGLVWAVGLGCIDFNPHPVRADDLEHPDELRVDLDPGPGVPWADVCAVALAARDVLAEHGFLERVDQQFHWHNEGYGTFEDFLATLASRHRKAIRRERRDALADGITIHALTGDGITPDAWDAFFEFYMETGSRKWGRPYLTRTAFDLFGQRLGDAVLLIMAFSDGQAVAGALNIVLRDAYSLDGGYVRLGALGFNDGRIRETYGAVWGGAVGGGDGLGVEP